VALATHETMAKNKSTQAFNAYDFGYRLSYDAYAAIGLLSVAFSDLELAWSFLVWSLIAQCDVITTHCDDPAGQGQRLGAVITAPLPFRRKVDVAVGLTLQRFQQDDHRTTQVRDIARVCVALEERRNTMIHSWWLPTGTPETGVDIRRTVRTKHGLDRKKGLMVGTEAGVDVPALIEVATQMGDCARDLHRVRVAMYPRSGD